MHIVKRQVLAIELSSRQALEVIEPQCYELYYEQVLPLLEECLDELVLEPQLHYQLDKLELDLGKIKRLTLTLQQRAELKRQIQQQLQQLNLSIAPEQSMAFTQDLSALNQAQITPVISQYSASSQANKQNLTVEDDRMNQKSAVNQAHAAPAISQHLASSQTNGNSQKMAENFSAEAQVCNVLPDLAAFGQAFCFFLQQGIFPWWYPMPQLAELQLKFTQLLKQQSLLLQTNWIVLLKQPAVITRLVNHLKVPQLTRLLQQLAPALGSVLPVLSLNKAWQIIQQLKSRAKRQTLQLHHWESLLELCTESNLNNLKRSQLGEKYWLKLAAKLELVLAKPACRLIEEVYQLTASEQQFKPLTVPAIERKTVIANEQGSVAGNTLTSNAQDSATRNTLTSNERDLATNNQLVASFDVANSVSVNNSGLVLLAPFLPALFKRLGWLTGQQFNSAKAMNKAALLLQYLAFGNQAVGEYELLLNKLLCGLAPETVLSPKLRLKLTEKQAAEQLLQAVMQHWAALKNMPMSGLQQLFLQRQGLIKACDDRYLLEVERKPQDVLLNRLPWAINSLSLTWCEIPLLINWTY